MMEGDGERTYRWNGTWFSEPVPYSAPPRGYSGMLLSEGKYTRPGEVNKLAEP